MVRLGLPETTYKRIEKNTNPFKNWRTKLSTRGMQIERFFSKTHES